MMGCYIHTEEHIPDELLEVHHIHPQAYGGPDAQENTTRLCSACHTCVHAAALKVYSGKKGAARDLVQRHLPDSPARQDRLWKLVEAVVRARREHVRTAEVPEAGLEAENQSTVKMQLDVPDWLHHRLKTLATGQGLAKYVLGVLENHAAVATMKPGAGPKELFAGPRAPADPADDDLQPSFTLLDPAR